jgi:hypothetical protein
LTRKSLVAYTTNDEDNVVAGAWIRKKERQHLWSRPVGGHKDVDSAESGRLPQKMLG